jgi:hypothetical protein
MFEMGVIAPRSSLCLLVDSTSMKQVGSMASATPSNPQARPRGGKLRLDAAVAPFHGDLRNIQ